MFDDEDFQYRLPLPRTEEEERFRRKIFFWTTLLGVVLVSFILYVSM